MVKGIVARLRESVTTRQSRSIADTPSLVELADRGDRVIPKSYSVSCQYDSLAPSVRGSEIWVKHKRMLVPTD